MPQSAEEFRSVPHSAATFRIMPQAAARSEHHTLTVREVARMFENANVSRSERTIVSWCMKNRQGASKLDAFFDMNERRYYITPESAARAIEEELSKRDTLTHSATLPQPSAADLRNPPQDTDDFRSMRQDAEAKAQEKEIEKLRADLLDLQITNKGKDFFIKQLQEERHNHIEQLLTQSRRVGELETKLLQLEAPSDRFDQDAR